MEKFYKIAGLTVKMDSFGMTDKQAEPYRIETQPSADFTVSTKGLDAEKKLPDCSEDVREYLVSGVVFYKNLLNFDGLMLHASAVVVDGRAYLFTAPSGTGKSTHTELWLKQFGSRAYILNDDKPALRLEDGTWYAYGTPWSGKNDISRNERIPLAGIAALERGENNEIEPFKGKEAVIAIMRQVNRPGATDSRIKLMQITDKLITQVPIWKLRCNMDPQAAVVAYEAMSGKGTEGEES